jgi:hypothetical protein
MNAKHDVSIIDHNTNVIPPTHLPPQISIPWTEICEVLQRPAVLSYSAYVLYNWRKIDNSRPISLENISPLHTFLGVVSEIGILKFFSFIPNF